MLENGWAGKCMMKPYTRLSTMSHVPTMVNPASSVSVPQDENNLPKRDKHLASHTIARQHQK